MGRRQAIQQLFTCHDSSRPTRSRRLFTYPGVLRIAYFDAPKLAHQRGVVGAIRKRYQFLGFTLAPPRGPYVCALPTNCTIGEPCTQN